MASSATALKTRRRGSGPTADTVAPPRNDQVDWNLFNPRIYHAHNYRTLRDDDRQLVTHVRDFFGSVRIAPTAKGLDIGPGANLYPSLSMLPFCGQVELVEYSAANIAWLRRQQLWLRRFDRSWDKFWSLYGEHPAYAPFVRANRPLDAFREKATVSPGSIFELKRARWDVGTMFFVACSLSADRGEFFRGVSRFLEALRPGAPFAAAFMTGSSGYEIKNQTFPAFPVNADIIKHALTRHAPGAEITPIKTDLRPEVGMVLATGFRRR
ncbi:SCO2525 family SAM-dependent methyltransferase [Dactylosporangium sp. McL0621]|uniref:SCO2525 family SAM-dependent methyltransferase n=1 Tax=Dactylosporangium sp. McL0621 TaxID=3415678 RepID=UPI003CFA53C9